jgi:hypothetical protein
LWDIVYWLTILAADRGTEVRYWSSRHEQRLDFRVGGRWYPAVQPFWHTHQLLKRLVQLLPKGTLTRLHLGWRYAGYRFLGAGIYWESPVVLGLPASTVVGVCRVLARGDKVAVKFRIPEVTLSVTSEAAEACRQIEEQIPRDLMIAKFLSGKGVSVN